MKRIVDVLAAEERFVIIGRNEADNKRLLDAIIAMRQSWLCNCRLSDPGECPAIEEVLERYKAIDGLVNKCR